VAKSPKFENVLTRALDFYLTAVINNNAGMLGEGLVVLNVNTKVKKVTEIVVR